MPVADHAWTPLLDGDDASRAHDAAMAIVEAVDRLPDAAIAFAAHDLALMNAYVASSFGCARDAQVDRYLAIAVQTLAEQPMQPALWGGFLGTAWTLEHLVDSTDGADPNDEVDRLLLAHLDRSGELRNFDLIHGLVGIGTYALERTPRPAAEDCVRRIVGLLGELVGRDGGWWTGPEVLPPSTREVYPAGCYNLGVAHGGPGVLAWLARAHRAGYERERIAPMIEAGVAWLLATRVDSDRGPVFADCIGPGVTPRPARSAWCYGDPGIAGALWLTARATGNDALASTAKEVARRAAARPHEDCSIVEPGLCHGSAGLGHIFNRLFQATGDDELASASLVWFRRTLELRGDRGIAGYRALIMSDATRVWGADPGLLSGAAGIAVALAAAASAVEPAWDRMLLLSDRRADG